MRANLANTLITNDMGDREPEDLRYFIIISTAPTNTNTNHSNDYESV